jgi:hypothetical protein
LPRVISQIYFYFADLFFLSALSKGSVMFRKIILLSCFALTAFAAQICSPAAFAQKVWNGSSDSNWTNPSNWDASDTPGTGDNVVIGGPSMTITGVSGISLNNLTINAGGTITLQGGGTIDVAGALAIQTSLILGNNVNIETANGSISASAFLGIEGGFGGRVNNTGTFNVDAGCQVRILGLTASPAISGNDISYAVGASLLYEFGGLGTHNVGAELPTVMNGNVIVNTTTDFDLRLQNARTINGDLNFIQGILNINSNSLTLNGAVNIAPANAFFQGFNGSLAINGAGALNGAWNFNIGAALANLTMNRPGATMLLQTDLTITDTLTLFDGNINCADNNVVLYVQNASSPAIVGGYPNSYVITSAVSGLLRRAIPNGFSPNSFKFPVGTAAGYFPYSLINANASAPIDVQVAAADAAPSAAIVSSHYLDVRQFGGVVTLTGEAILESPLVQSAGAVATSATAAPFSAYANLPVASVIAGNFVQSQSYSIDAASRYIALAGSPTYQWAGAPGADWQNPASWSPPRYTPAANDELVFNAGVHTPTNIPHQTISLLRIRTGANVTFSASNPTNWLTATGTPFGVLIEPDGSLDLGAPATNIALNIASSSECVVEGRLQTQNSAVIGDGYFYLEDEGLLATTRDDGINGASISGGAIQTASAWYSSQARYEFTSASPGEERDMNFMARGGKSGITFMRALYVGASAGTRRLNSQINVTGFGLLAVQKAAAAQVFSGGEPEIVIQGRMTLHSSRSSSLIVGNQTRLVVRDGGELWNNGHIALYDDNEVLIENGFLTMVGPNGGGGSGTGSIDVGYGTIRYSGASLLSFTGGGAFTTNDVLLPPSMPARVSVSNGSVVVLDGDKSLLAGLDLLSEGKIDLNNHHLILTGLRANGGALLASAGSFRGSRFSSLSLGGVVEGDIAFDSGFNVLGSLWLNFTANAPPPLRGNVQVMDALSLQNGILSVSEPNALTLAAAAPSSLTGGSATSYIRGALRRSLQANIALDGQTYFFPVGDTTYRPFALANVRTGGNAPILAGRSFAAGANSWLAPLSGGAPYNWFAQTLSGDFLTATFQAGGGAPIPAGLRVATAPAQNGDYADIGADDSSPLRASLPQAARVPANGAYFALGAPAPSVVSFAPRAARPGETVTITGAFLTGVTGVRFGGSPAQNFTVVSPTQITAVVGLSGASGALTLQSAVGETTAALPFTWLGQPTITSVSPGAVAGVGQVLTIRGSEYHTTPEVRIGEIRAASVTAASLAELRVVFAQATTGVLSIHASGGSVSWTQEVAILAPPMITDLSPTNPTPGSLVTITGTNFAQGFTQVFIGSVPVQATVNSPTRITFVAPASANAPLAVVTPAGTARSTGAVVIIPPPVIANVTPAEARVGESLAIVGENFINVESVAVGNIPTSFIVQSPTSIAAVAPPFGSLAEANSETSSASVRVRTRTGEALYARITLRRSPSPAAMSLLSFSPAAVVEGDSVRVLGANIPQAVSLRLRSAFAEAVVAPVAQAENGGAVSLLFQTPTNLIPPDMTSTEASITAEAQSPSGLQTAQAPGTLRIHAADAPAFAGFSPVVGGVFTPIVISGRNFNVSPRGAVRQILIGGVPAREFVVVSPTEIHAIAGQVIGGAMTIITGSGALTTSASFAVNPLLDAEPVHPSDSLALNALFAATNGALWTTSTNWTNGFPVALRFGVRVQGGRVVELTLPENNLSGILPWESLTALTALRSFNIAGNAVGGSLPQNLCGLSSLRELNLTDNRFEGGVEALCCLPTGIERVQLGNNRLAGFLPECLRNFPLLQVFNVERNSFIGGFPTFLTQIPQIEIINLRGNGFSGIVPPSIADVPVAAAAKARNSALAAVESLRSLDIGENSFSGEIPQEIGAFIGLRELLLDGNRFMGALPQSIVNLRNLQTLNVRNNSLSDAPDLARSIPRLQTLDAAGNRLGFDRLERLAAFPLFVYAPQRIEPPALSDTVAVLDSPFEFHAALAGEHNRYQWFKNGVPLGEPSANDTLFFPAFAPSDSGAYFCAVTNEKLPLLSVSTSTVLVRAALPDSPPAQVALLSPAPAETDAPALPLFRWSAAEGAGRYRIEISLHSAFSDLVGTFIAPQTAETLRSGEVVLDARAQGLAQLEKQTRYFWRVRAENARGNGEWTSADFTTAAETTLGATRLNFGKIPLGDTAFGFITLRNLSASPARIVGAIVSDHPAFVFDAPESEEIPAGADIRLRARFIPRDLETVVAAIRIPLAVGNAAPQTQSLATRLVGRGGALKIIPPSVDTSVIGSIKLLAVQIENRSAVPSVITKVELRRGAREYSFRTGAGNGIPLGAGDTTAVLVKFIAERAGLGVEEIYCESSTDTVRSLAIQHGRARRPNDIIANVVVRAVPPSAPPGERVAVEIYLADANAQELRNILLSTIPRVRASIRLNRNVLALHPSAESFVRAVGNQDGKSAEQRYNIAPTFWEGRDSVLFRIPCVAVAGLSDTTRLTLEELSWGEASLYIRELSEGTFTTLLSRAGGKRRIGAAQSNAPAQILSVSPNPGAGLRRISFMLSARFERVQLRVVDMLGGTVFLSSAAALEAGAYSVEADLRSLPAGQYTAILEADRERAARGITVVR